MGTFSIVHQSGAPILLAEQIGKHPLDASLPVPNTEQRLSEFPSIDSGGFELPGALPIARPDRVATIPAIQPEPSWSLRLKYSKGSGLFDWVWEGGVAFAYGHVAHCGFTVARKLRN